MAAAADPVAAVRDAHRAGALLALRTSGTSGARRSVVRTTSSWFDSFADVTRLLGMDARSRVWLPGPLTATMNLFAAVHAADLGALTSPRPDQMTHAVLTPHALARALAQPVDLTDVHVLVAGDRLGRPLRDATLARGAGAVSHYYGAAELSFVGWGTHDRDLRPFPGVRVECRDGEVWVRSRYLCERYDGPVGPLRRAADGFMTVGDRGHVEDGHLRLRGRAEDTVVTGGATVHLSEVEAALETATGHRVAAVGIPHSDLGEVLCGVVVDGTALPVLRERARELLDPAQRPRRWFEVSDLPLTAAGKLDRVRLAAVIAARRSVGSP